MKEVRQENKLEDFSLFTAICSPAKQNDRPHESYLAQVMAKILLFNFVLLPNF